MKLKRRVFWLWCALLFEFGFLIAGWIYNNLASGVGFFHTMKGVGAMLIVVGLANAKVLIFGPAVVSVIKDIKDLLGR